LLDKWMLTVYQLIQTPSAGKKQSLTVIVLNVHEGSIISYGEGDSTALISRSDAQGYVCCAVSAK